MSDAARNEQQRVSAPAFLRRVIDGAFERASPLEPRRPSLFEPQTVALSAAVDWPGELAGSGEERAARSQVEDRPGQGVHRQTVPSDAPASRELRRTTLGSPNGSRRRTAQETARLVGVDRESEVAAGLGARSPARPSEQEPERNVLTPKPPPMTVDTHRDSRAGQEREPRHSVLDSASGVLVAQSVISTTETTLEPTVVRAPEGRDALPRPTARSEGSRDRPVVPAHEVHRIIVEPRTAMHRAARDPLHAEVATPSSEPVVNVTIGRIEVRAVPAQSGPSRQRPQGPKPMSLDDYLQRRGGGR